MALIEAVANLVIGLLVPVAAQISSCNRHAAENTAVVFAVSADHHSSTMRSDS